MTEGITDGNAPLLRTQFATLLSYRVLSIVSYQITSVTVGWHVYELTRNPLSLGLIGLAEVIPYFCFALFAGYAVDHLPRRKLGLAACICLSFTGLLLTALSAGWLPSQDVWMIYAAIAVTGVARAFLAPIYNALFARVLPRERFARGASFGSVAFQASLVTGPAIGGVLVGWAGKTAAYSTAAALALLAGVVLLRLRVTEPVAEGTRAPIFTSIGEGLRFVFGNQIVLSALALDMFAVLFGGAVAVLPAFIQEILHYGPEGLGILRGAPALGAVAMGLWLTRHPPGQRAGRWLLMAVAGFGVCIIGFGLSTHFWLSAALLLMSGVFDSVSMVMRSTILQLATPDHMRGRVSSINGIFIGSSNELGAFYCGSMARLLGLVPAVVLGGFMTLGVVAVTSWKAPVLRRLNIKDLH